MYVFHLNNSLHNSINTIDTLQALPDLYLSPNWCSLFKKNNDTMDHLFIHYEVTRGLWNKLETLPGTVYLPHTPLMAALLFKTFASNNQNSQKKIIAFNSSVAICWAIWNEKQLLLSTSFLWFVNLAYKRHFFYLLVFFICYLLLNCIFKIKTKFWTSHLMSISFVFFF